MSHLPNYKRQTKISTNTSKNNSLNNSLFRPLKSLKTILKEKLLYDYICNIHNNNYFKYCITCKKDICFKCETQYHHQHTLLNYENLLPDFNETNIIQKEIKEYEKKYFEFMNIINIWKKDFDKMINEYDKEMNNIFQYIKNFNKDKNNINNIYKFRNIITLILDSNYDVDEKNNKIIELMNNILQDKNYIKKIKNDYDCVLSQNKLKDLINALNTDSLLDKIEKIINAIDYKNVDINKTNIRKSIEITPNIKLGKNDNYSYTKNNTSASTFGKNHYRFSSNTIDQNQNIIENSLFKLNPYTYRNRRVKKSKDINSHSKSTNDIIYQNNNIYERKKIREKSDDYIKISKINNELENIDDSNNNKYIENEKKIKNNLQESINKIKINQNIYNNYINSNCNHKIVKRKKRRNLIACKTQNLVNKSLLYDYKGFDINDKDSGAELLNNSSFTIQGVKYCSNSLRSNSLEYRPYKDNYFTTFGRIFKDNSNYNSLDNKYRNRTLNIENDYSSYKLLNGAILKEKAYKTLTNDNYINYNSYNRKNFSRNHDKNNIKLNGSSLYDCYQHKTNNSVLNVNNVNNSFSRNNNLNSISQENSAYSKNELMCNQIYNNSKINKRIFVHKKFAPLDDIKNLSSIESISNSVSSPVDSNINKNNPKVNTSHISRENSQININGNKSLFIGLELGNNECKIGVINEKNNFELFNINNNSNIPTVISFIENNINHKIEIKIGEETEELKVSNASQTIFNIIKLIGKSSNEIVGRKELWPFNIYNDEKTNKPYIQIKINNNLINYYFEELLIIFLKELFSEFFNKINISKLNEGKENKLIDLNIIITVPNYYNYIQRKIIENIFRTKLFPKNEMFKKNKIFIKENKYGKYNVQLKNIKIESASNLASFCLLDKDKMSNDIKDNISNYLIVYIEGGSVNISIISLNSKNNSIIEVKGISGAEFGEEDFLDNFIYTCLSDFKDKIKRKCLNSPKALAKLRKSLNIVKNCFNKEDIFQTEVNINKLYDVIDLKMTVNKNEYIKSCMGLFRKIIYLIKETLINSNIEIKDINDILLIGNIAQNMKLRNMINELFKDKNNNLYNKLKNEKIDIELNNYIVKGAIIQCFNNNMTIPKYKLANITHSSFGIESLNGIMNFVIEKGNNIPIKFNKYIKIKRTDKNGNNMININIYEGENKYVKNNKLISRNFIDIKNLKNEKIYENYIEILFQFFIDSNYNLYVYLLDKNTFRRKFEFLINIESI